jgi:uncharacterized protein
MNAAPQTDWKALEFKCSREADRLPNSDEQANDWYKTANELYRLGARKNDESILKQSLTLLHKAAERGHVKAMNNIVLAYMNGEGTKQDDAKAVEWAEKLIALEVGMGYYHMGVFLQQGIGVKPDRAAALSYFRRSADLGNAQGQLVAGEQLLRAAAETTSKAKGFEIGRAMLTCALGQGLAKAGHVLGGHFLIVVESVAEALNAYQAAAKLGHDQSLFKLATLFEEGRDGVPKDEARATCYRRLLSELDADKSKTFPNLDQICPLPPRKMPGA